MATTLNPATTSTKCTLSGGNLTVEKTSGSGYGSAASQGSAGGATKVYVEAVLDVNSGAAGVNAFGVASRTDGFQDNYVGLGNFSAGWYTDGSVYRNNASVGTIATIAAGHRVAMAADTSARTVQFRNITTASAWSAAFSIAHDAAGVPYYFVFSAGATGAKATFIADAPFVGTPPDGSYVEWDGGTIGGVTAYTLTATVGTATLTGTTTNLRRALPLTATTAALALVGTTTNLRRALPLTATTAALALTGTATNLRRALTLTATQGALALSGTVTNLVYTGSAAAYTLIATVGALALNGTATNFLRGLVLAAQSGLLALTGRDASLVHSALNQYTLAAMSGSLALEGGTANLIARQLERQPGPLVFGRRLILHPRHW